MRLEQYSGVKKRIPLGILYTLIFLVNMAEEVSTTKRRRKESLHVFDIPDNAVAHVASYLSNISRAIFAIASPSAMKSTILSSDKILWETLDFGDIDQRLARRLKDGGLRDILRTIDAVNNTKRIKLTGCINIDGSGMSPLRGSVVLRQLDLGLVGQYESPTELVPDPLISEESAVPILTRIINTEGNSLTHLTLPKKWRNTRSTQLTNFLEAYNAVLASREIKCTNCNILVSEVSLNNGHIHHNNNIWYGLQNDVCYTCLKSYCNNCYTDDEDERNWLVYCNHCEKDFCADCSSMGGVTCDICAEDFCIGCEDTMKTCQRCKSVVCGGCAAEKCSCVNRFLCVECAPESHKCEWGQCNERFCADCQDDHLLSHRVFK